MRQPSASAFPPLPSGPLQSEANMYTSLSNRTRDYETIEALTTLIMRAVDVYGYDVPPFQQEAYEMFASEGMNGDPDDLPETTYRGYASDILDIADDVVTYLKERAA